MIYTYQIFIKGIVQGVGFRPFIYNLVKDKKLNGIVRNSTKGVEIIVNCDDKKIDFLIEEIQLKAPPLAHILAISYQKITYKKFKDFTILHSEFSEGITLVHPDVATCKDCEAELFDKRNYRYLYPFINCTNCGPRFSIIKALPYDREKTTMKTFEMCERCKKEYSEPENRRFHAEPICCEKCGPNVYYNNYRGIEAIKEIALLIDNGSIVAVKGLGGYHLICDATNNSALVVLREKKRRRSKPFAVMCKNVATLKHYVELSDEEIVILESRESPILVIKKHIEGLSPLVNPIDNNRSIGIMLPYTPVHKLIFSFIKTPFIIATSGNLVDEPISINAESAEEKLNIITRHFLHHTRDIYNRVDDSVVTLIENKIYTIRRARGLAPYPILLSKSRADVAIGLGAHLKNTLCLNIDNFAVVSQFIGDLDSFETISFFDETLDHLLKLYNKKASLYLTDLHPDYYTSGYAANSNVPYKVIQHHLAHFASCMAENNLTDNIIGVIFDGVGLGYDGDIWGGEFFIKMGAFKRVYHLDYYKQAGGDAAAIFPYRMLISYLYKEGLLSSNKEVVQNIFEINNNELSILEYILKNDINAPKTSSMGRLFEGVGSLLLKLKKNEFEAHSAMALEALCVDNLDEFYPFTTEKNIIFIGKLIESIFSDFLKGTSKNLIATKFHNTIAQIILHCCNNIKKLFHLNDVVFSGGVFQNIYLLKRSIKLLREHDFNVFLHSRVPPNDGGISLGQVYFDLMDFKYEQSI
jgi:hydrogenase maturation protein HypF